MDTLVATRLEYLLGSWIHEARAWGKTSGESDYYEHKARQIITTWGAPGSGLTDYARREWSGLLATYYLPRWNEFISELDVSLVYNKPFDAKAYRQWRLGFEAKWENSTVERFSTLPVGDSVSIARAMFEKYRGM